MKDSRNRAGLMPTNKEIAIRSILESVPTGRELVNFVCGEFLGAGVSRAVFVYKPNPKLVIKFETGDMMANVIENHIWQSVKHSDLSEWFAPVEHISHNGRILLMKRCQVPKDYEEYPERVPVFLTDLKYKNFGRLGKRIVCFDYAVCLLNQYGLTKKTKRAVWWDQETLL